MDNMGKLDSINQFFVDHYKNLEHKNDVEHLAYGTDDKLGQMWMEYHTSTQVAVRLLFDKKNNMYHFRSEKEYAQFNMEQAVSFAKNTVEQYHGCRCIAYDNKMILQLVGSYRNMEEKEAEHKLEDALGFFESDIRNAFADFEEFYQAENTEKKQEESADGMEAVSLQTERTTEDVQDLGNDHVDFEIMEGEIIPSEDFIQEFNKGLQHFAEEEPHGILTAQNNGNVSQENELNELLSDLTVLEQGKVNNPTEDKEDTQSVVKERKEELLNSLQKLLALHGQNCETRTKGRYLGQFFKDDVRFSFRYYMEENPDIIKIQASRKYPEQKNVLQEQWKELERVDVAVYKMKEDIIAIERILKAVDAKQFLDTVEIIQCQMQKLDEVITNYQDNNDTVCEQLPIHTLNDELEQIYQKRELLLKQQRKETLDALRELNKKMEDAVQKEIQLKKTEEQLSKKELTLSTKEAELNNRENIVLQKEKETASTMQLLGQKEHTLNQKETELQAKDSALQQEIRKNKEERIQNEQERERLFTEQKLWKDKYQERENLIGSLTIKINALNEQKDDILSIIQLKSMQLQGGVSFSQLEKELEDARAELVEKNETVIKLRTAKSHLEKEINRLTEDNVRLNNLVENGMEKKEPWEQDTSNDKYKEAVSLARRAATLCNEMKAERKQLSDENAELKNSVNKLSDEKNKLETEKNTLKEKLEEAMEKLQKKIPKNVNPITTPVSAESFMDYLKEKKGAADEMLEILHAADGNIIKIKGDVNIMVSLKVGMSFVECYTEEHIGIRLMKKIESYNAKNGKTILYSTGNRLYARTMFELSSSEDEIYDVMELTASVFECL